MPKRFSLIRIRRDRGDHLVGLPAYYTPKDLDRLVMAITAIAGKQVVAGRQKKS